MKRSILLVLTLVLLLILAPLALAAGTGEAANLGGHARFCINGTLYSIFQDGNDQQHVTTDGSDSDVELPEGVSYSLADNKLTLTSAQLQTLEILYEVTNETGEVVDYWLPNPDLTIVLEGESTITAPSNHGMYIANGVNATVTGAAGSALALSVPASDGGRAIRVEQNSALTIAGETSVTATITGSFESEEYAEVIAMGVYDSDLTVQDSATLTATADQVENNYSIDVVSGTMTVTGSAKVNANSTLALGRYEEDDPLGNLIMNGESHLIIRDYDAGLMLNGADVTVSGGDLDIDLTTPVNDNEQNTDEIWPTGISCNGSTMELCGGNVTIDFPNGSGINLDASRDDTGNVLSTSSLTQSGGTLTITADDDSVDSYAIFVNVAMSSNNPNTATFTGGTTELQAVKGLEVGQNCEVTISGNADILVNGIVPGDAWWGLNSVTGTLNIYGGSLTVNANKAIALEIADQGSFNQSGGVVTLNASGSVLDADNYIQAMGIFESSLGSMTISDGTINATSDYFGMYLSGSFSLLGGTINTYGDDRGMMVVDGSATLAGGSLNATTNGDGADYPSVAVLAASNDGENGSLTITGGNHSFLASPNYNTYGLVSDGADVRFEGGVVNITGQSAVIWQGTDGYNTTDGANRMILADGLHAVSNVTGNELQFVYEVEYVTANETNYTYHCYYFTEDSTEDGDDCTDVTISSEAGEIPVDYTGTMEITSGQATVGAPVVIKYTVATRGTVSISLPNNLRLIDGSATVNGQVVSSLQNITVDGAAVIRFSVTPMNTNPAVITATATVGDKSYQTTLPVTASGFQASAPTVTKVPDIYVSGYGTSGDKITLEVTGQYNNTETFTGEVSSLGTFKIQVELPVKDPTKEEDFTIAVYFANPNTRSGGTLGTTLEVTYDPDSVSVTILSITNIVHNSKGWKVPVTIDVNYANNQVLQSYYTYWPDEPTFDFAVEFDVPEGWKIARAVVVVTYQGGATETVELEAPGPGDRNQWKGETDAPNPSKPPVSYKVGWIALPEESTADGSGMPLAYTAPTAFLPIMDPSGTVISGSLDNPVPGATVTLYYGGDGENPDAANADVFDMTNYGQVNPQVSDALGNYAWNVPEGWWQIVATYELNGKTYTSKSEWLHVMPIQEGVNLDLNLPTANPDTPHTPSGGTTATKPSTDTSETFRDVSKRSYYYDAVTWAVENGVTDGTGSNTFSPDKACTRAEIVTFLWRAAGKPAAKSSVNPFTDVSKSAYYYDAVLWAVEAGITQGTSATTFSPDKTCTRAEAVTFLYRAASGKASSGTVPFTDVPANAYYKDAVLWAVAENVTQGTGSSTFSPDKTCSRAEIVTFLYRSPLSE